MRIKNINIAACNSCSGETYGGNNNVDSSHIDSHLLQSRWRKQMHSSSSEN